MTGDEQTNTESDPGAAQTEQTSSAPPPQQATASHEHRNQWISFGILILILFGTVLIIALLRPLIFGHIVPAVMGESVTPLPAVVDDAYPPAAEEAMPTGENEVFIPAASGGGIGDAVPAEESVVEDETPALEETAVSSEPAPEPVTHTVQVGDNLTKISAQYGIPVQEIMVVNNLSNADYISVGQVLIIPTN